LAFSMSKIRTIHAAIARASFTSGDVRAA
jgi:hypothetical protein